MEFHYPNESLPDILQPARVTSSSKTLIENVFPNTISLNTLFGNHRSSTQFLIAPNISLNPLSLKFNM